jgi:hypothetical protein
MGIFSSIKKAVKGVVHAVGNAISSVGKAALKLSDFVVDKIIEPVVKTVGTVIQSAINDPLKTIAQVTAVATGNAWALPLIEGADVAIAGGSITDVLTATAKAYVAQEVGDYVGKTATGAAAKATDSALAGKIIGRAASAASVAVVTGQDPLKALVNGGVAAATGAVLGKVTEATGGNFSKLPPTVQAGIQAAITAKITGSPVGPAVIGSVIKASNIVTDAITSFDPDGKKLDDTQRTIVTDVLMGTATAALTGGNASNVIQAAMTKAGTKALGDMASGAFKSAAAAVKNAFNTAEISAAKLTANQNQQEATAANYNKIATAIEKRIAEQNKLRNAYTAAVKTFNENPTEGNGRAANETIQRYNAYVTQLNKDYEQTYKPELAKYADTLDRLKQEYAIKSGDYEKAIQAFGTETDKLSDALAPVYRASNRAFVEAMDENFNADQYRTLNGLGADVDPYEHFLSKGQFEGVPTNNKAAEPAIIAERTRLVTQALESKGVTLATADPAMISKILDNIDKNYGNNISALKSASIKDVINGNATLVNKLVSDQQNGVLRIEVSGGSYGAWNKPADFTPPTGTKLASVEAFNSGAASLVYDKKGNPVWVEDNPSATVAAWNPTTGTYELPKATATNKKQPTGQEKILAMASMGNASAANGSISQAMIDAAKTVVGWAQQSGNSTLINASANVLKAGGGFLESINGMSVLLGVAPSTTTMGKFATALNNLGKASNTAEYQAAVKNMNSIIGDAKGVGGTLKAIYGAFKSAPLQFVAEYVGVEGIQEIAPLLIGGVAAGGAKGAALALKYGQAVAAKMGTAVGMTASIATDIAESAGGAATSAYNEAYKTAIKVGKTPADADKIAMDIAQRQAFVAAATTAASMGIGGAALEKALLGRTGTGLGDAMQALGDFAKTGTKITIKESVSEGGEEGITQAALEGQLYKLDKTRDVAKEITQAVAFGAIAGGPIAGGAYGASRTGDVISNASQGNPRIANILETYKGDPLVVFAAAALDKFGVTDNTIKSNLMNTIDNTNYTSSNEAAVALAKRNDYTYSDADVKALTGKGTDTTLDSRAEAYVDPKVFDLAEVKAAAAAEGYIITDEEAAKFVGQKDEATATIAAKTEFDPKATNYDEAKSFFAAKGYTPSENEIKQFIGDKTEAAQAQAITNYINPRQVTFDEAKKYLADQGYTPTDAEIKKFVGQVNETEQVKAVEAYVDPRTVNAKEVIDAYVALGLSKPTDADVKKLVGQYDESGLTAKATDYLPTARYNSIMAELDKMSAGGISAEAKAAIDLVRTDLTKSMADTGLEVAKVALKVDTAKADLQKAITALGTSTDKNFASVDKAIQDLRDAGLTVDDVKATVDKIVGSAGTDKVAATGIYAHIDEVNTALQANLAQTEKSILAEVAKNEQAGMTRDAALQKAIDTVAATQKTDAATLTSKLSGVQTALGKEIAGVQADLQTKYATLTAEQKALATQLTNQGIDLNTAIATAKGEVQTQIGALQDVVGRGTQQATQSDLNAVINLLETQGAYDAQYDYNGDKVIDQKDKVAIETALAYKPDTNDPFVYNPATGSKWAPTGVFKAVQDEAAATRQAQQNEAAATRRTQAAAALKTQRMGNLNTMINMVGQADDTGGQQVTVKAADPAKIGYIYDWNSIFANPAQEKMFASPFARGGMVDNVEDVNDELLKLLKG